MSGLAPWEQWLTAVTDARRTSTGSHGRMGEALPRQSVSFRLVMAVLARYADHDTGTNARPSLRRLQALTHLSHPTVRKALDTAEELGFITSRGLWEPPNGGRPVTVWSLGYPTPAGFIGWDAVSGGPAGPHHRDDTAGPHHRSKSNDAAGPHHRDSESMMRLERVNDAAPGGVNDTAQPHMTSSTSRPQGSEEDDESASAPAPEGAALTRLETDVHTVLRQRWPDDQPVVSKRTRQRLAEMLAAGWTGPQIVAAINTIGKNPRNPALLLEAHLTKVLTEHEPRDFGVWDTSRNRVSEIEAEDVEAISTSSSELEPPKKRGGSTPTPTPRDVADVLAGDDRNPPGGFRYRGKPTTIHDPRRDVRARPPGWEQAQREADNAERQRIAEQLAQLPPEREDTPQ